jgi:hypothetical protein
MVSAGIHLAVAWKQLASLSPDSYEKTGVRIPTTIEKNKWISRFHRP